MTDQTPDDERETASLRLPNRRWRLLLKRLHDKRVCPCCTARALTYHGRPWPSTRWAAPKQSNVRGHHHALERARHSNARPYAFNGSTLSLAGGGWSKFETASRSTRAPFHAQIFLAHRNFPKLRLQNADEMRNVYVQLHPEGGRALFKWQQPIDKSSAARPCWP